MMNKSHLTRFLGLSLTLAGVVFTSGIFTQVNAQRDPFMKPGYARPRPVRTGGGIERTGGPAVEEPGVPTINQRIEYYKRLRENAAANGAPLPKVTSVLTLNEMAVTGIFHTPRGYAAMVEATPIKLSYTIYPGEKFFDGQLVAVEENRLVFKRVTKVAKGKFVTSVENKPLRQFTTREQIQGTAPVETTGRPTETASNNAPVPADAKPVLPAVIISPLDEMNRAPEPQKGAKSAKKPAKVARNKR